MKPIISRVYNHGNPHDGHYVLFWNNGHSEYKTFTTLRDAVNNVNENTMSLGINLVSCVLELSFFADEIVATFIEYQERQENG